MVVVLPFTILYGHTAGIFTTQNDAKLHYSKVKTIFKQFGYLLNYTDIWVPREWLYYTKFSIFH